MDNHRVQVSFATRFKELREEKGLSQGDLAKELGVSRGSISYYENAERTAGIDFAYQAAEFFGTSVDYLLGKSDLRVADFSADNAAAFTGLSDKAVSILHSIKRRQDAKSIFKVLNLLIEQDPPFPSKEDFIDSRGDEIDEQAFFDACHKWKISHTHVLSNISQYLFFKPDPAQHKKIVRESDDSYVIDDYDFVLQVYLNVVQNSIRQLRKVYEHENL